jgi:hypothetical protein
MQKVNVCVINALIGKGVKMFIKGSKVITIQDQPKFKAGETGTVLSNKLINNTDMVEVVFEGGKKLYINQSFLVPESASKEELALIKPKPLTPSDRVAHLIQEATDSFQFEKKEGSLSDEEQALKLKLKDIQNQRKKISTAKRKVEEAVRRFTKIKGLSDNAILQNIEDTIKI